MFEWGKSDCGPQAALTRLQFSVFNLTTITAMATEAPKVSNSHIWGQNQWCRLQFSCAPSRCMPRGILSLSVWPTPCGDGSASISTRFHRSICSQRVTSQKRITEAANPESRGIRTLEMRSDNSPRRTWVILPVPCLELYLSMALLRLPQRCVCLGSSLRCVERRVNHTSLPARPLNTARDGLTLTCVLCACRLLVLPGTEAAGEA